MIDGMLVPRVGDGNRWELPPPPTDRGFAAGPPGAGTSLDVDTRRESSAATSGPSPLWATARTCSRVLKPIAANDCGTGESLPGTLDVSAAGVTLGRHLCSKAMTDSSQSNSRIHVRRSCTHGEGVAACARRISLSERGGVRQCTMLRPVFRPVFPLLRCSAAASGGRSGAGSAWFIAGASSTGRAASSTVTASSSGVRRPSIHVTRQSRTAPLAVRAAISWRSDEHVVAETSRDRRYLSRCLTRNFPMGCCGARLHTIGPCDFT